MTSKTLTTIKKEIYNIYISSDEKELKYIYENTTNNVKDGFLLFNNKSRVYSQCMFNF